MSIVSSIRNSKDDLVKPKSKTYWGFGFDISLVDANRYRDKKNPSPTEKRMLRFDLSNEEHIEKVIVLNNSKKSLGRFTTEQIKKILDDMGFNVNPTFGGKHLADIEAVMSVGGYSIPGWIKLARLIAKILPSREKLLVTKLSPGRDRLHVIAFEENDGSWAFAAHTDYNWLSLNLPRIYKAHIGHGAGDYITGTLMFCALLTEFGKKVAENKILTVKEIENILKDAYGKSVVEKFNLQKSSSLGIL